MQLRRMFIRVSLYLFILTMLAGLGIYAYKRFFNVVTLSVAVERLDGKDAEILRALSQWFEQEKRLLRFRFIEAGSTAKALDLVRNKQVNLASIRTDDTMKGGINSLIVLYKERAILAVPHNSPIEAWKDLKGKTIALPDKIRAADPLIQALLKAYNVTDAKLVSIPSNEMHEQLRLKKIHAVAFVTPLTEDAGTHFLPKEGKEHLKIIDIDKPDEILGSDKRFQEDEIPLASLRASPALPPETTSTFSVNRHLISPSRLPNRLASFFLRQIIDGKRALEDDRPLMREMTAPDDDKTAIIPEHPGANLYFSDEETSIADYLLENIYVIPMLLGGFGSIIVWFFHLFSPKSHRNAGELYYDILQLKKQIEDIEKPHELSELRHQLNEMQALFEKNLKHGGEYLENADSLLNQLKEADDALTEKEEVSIKKRAHDHEVQGHDATNAKHHAKPSGQNVAPAHFIKT